MIKRVLFALLYLPFAVSVGLIVLLSGAWWVFTDKDLFFIIDWMRDKMQKLL